MNGTRKASLAFNNVLTEELVAMPAAPFAEVVVAPMCFYSKGIDVAMIVHGDDFFAEGRAEAPASGGRVLAEQVPDQPRELGGHTAQERYQILPAREHLRHRRLDLDGRPCAQQEAGGRVQPWRSHGRSYATTPGSKATAANQEIQVARGKVALGLVMRGKSTPRVLDEARRHRVVRYIAGHLDWLFRWQGGGETLKALWPGGRRSRSR